MLRIKDCWSGWIPTNRGKIEFDYIRTPSEHIPSPTKQTAKHISFQEVNVSYLSDSITYAKWFVKQSIDIEYTAKATVNFYRTSENIKGDIVLWYTDKGSVSSNFCIKPNGIICFDGFVSSFSISIPVPVSTIKNILYVVVKSMVHGDAHHHQKIDIALPIIEGKFCEVIIAENLLSYIKLVEKNIKQLKQCESMQRNEQLVIELEGYLAYFKSFVLLFPHDKVKDCASFAEQVIKSAKATIDKRKNKQIASDALKTALVTFIGLFISINILLVGLRGQNSQSDLGCFLVLTTSHSNEMVISLFIILVGFLSYIDCKFKSWVYYRYYHFFELMLYVRILTFRKLTYLGIFLKMLPFLFFLSAVLLVIWA